MANNISVSYQALDQAAAALQSGKEDMLTVLASLQVLVDAALVDGFSTRVASPRFDQFNRQWNQSTRALLDGLDDIARAIRDAQQKHESVDGALGTGVDNIPG